MMMAYAVACDTIHLEDDADAGFISQIPQA